MLRSLDLLTVAPFVISISTTTRILGLVLALFTIFDLRLYTIVVYLLYISTINYCQLSILFIPFS